MQIQKKDVQIPSITAKDQPLLFWHCFSFILKVLIKFDDLMKKLSVLLHKNRTVVKPDKAAMAGNFSTACLLFFSTHYGNSASCEVFIGGIQNFQFHFSILNHLFFLKWCPTFENYSQNTAYFSFVYINLWPKIYLILCFSLGNLINHITQHVIWIDFSQFDVNVLFNLCAKDWWVNVNLTLQEGKKNIVKK